MDPPLITGPVVSNNTGIITGIFVLILAVGLVAFVVITILLSVRVVKKRRLQQAQESE